MFASDPTPLDRSARMDIHEPNAAVATGQQSMIAYLMPGSCYQNPWMVSTMGVTKKGNF